MAAVDPALWAGRRVLVTGHTGFKGAWLCLWLHALGAELTGYSALEPVSEPSLHEGARVGELLRREHRADVRDQVRMIDAVREARPEVVFHLAAQAIVRRSLEQPLETFDVNVAGTASLLDALRVNGLAEATPVVVATSDKVYANDESGRAFSEDDRLGGRDPYSASKAAQELVCAAYRETLGVRRLATVRAGNVIGGGDWAPDRLVPDALRAALAGTTLEVRTPGSVRPWQHVLCPLSGYLLVAQALAESDEAARGWNFGPDDGDARPVRDVVERLAELWPGGLDVGWGSEDDGSEARLLRVDATRARVALGWEPRWGLDDGLRATVEWFAGQRDGTDPRTLCSRQIEAFGA